MTCQWPIAIRSDTVSASAQSTVLCNAIVILLHCSLEEKTLPVDVTCVVLFAKTGVKQNTCTTNGTFGCFLSARNTFDWCLQSSETLCLRPESAAQILRSSGDVTAAVSIGHASAAKV